MEGICECEVSLYRSLRLMNTLRKDGTHQHANVCNQTSSFDARFADRDMVMRYCDLGISQKLSQVQANLFKDPEIPSDDEAEEEDERGDEAQGDTPFGDREGHEGDSDTDKSN